jgi:uncharacterized Ntn-hydrolase superfamily protein
MTFSLLGFDANSQSVGICSITSTPAHGSRCPHFLQDVGIVATQGLTNRHHGENCITLLANGVSPEECLRLTKADDINIEYRQLAIMTCKGQSAAHTGAETRDFKGHIITDHCIAVGNILTGEKVLHAMLDGFTSSNGDLADRLLSGARSGEMAGGEINGAYSAFLIVIRPDQIPAWGAHIDLRIDYSPNVTDVLTDALAQYRKWARDRLGNTKYTLDNSPPGAPLQPPAY